MPRGQYEGVSAFLFDTPEEHKQFALMLIGEGVTMSDVTRAIGRVMPEDASIRRKIIAVAKKMRDAKAKKNKKERGA